MLRPRLPQLTEFVLTAAVLAPAGGCETSNESPQHQQSEFARDLERAETRVRNSDTAEAKAILSRLLASRPRAPKAMALMGEVLYQEGDDVGARQMLSRASAAQPDDARIHRLLGDTLRRSQKLDDAVLAYRRAFELEPDVSANGVLLAEAMLAAGRVAEAETVLRTIEGRDPKALTDAGAGVNTVLGDALRAQDKLDLALAAYMKAQTVYPSDARAFAGAARVYEAKKDLKSALDQWAAYIQRDCCSHYSKTVAQERMMELLGSTPDPS